MAGIFRLEGHAIRLQSLRGIAALCVAVGHTFTLMRNGRIEDAHFALRPGNALLAAGELLIQPNTAVILFYVLSGLVLGVSLRRHAAASVRGRLSGFAIRRLWRLLPVMWLSILFAAAAAILMRGAVFAGTTAWFAQFAAVVLSPTILLENLLGLSYSINSVLWSIQIELVMIALLPPMAWLSGRTSLAVDVAIVAALYLGAVKFWGAVPNVALFAYCFYLGVVLPKFLANDRSARWLGNGFGVIVALALLVLVEYLYVSGRLWLPYKFLVDAVVSAYLAFVLLRPDCKGARFLDRPALVWLGDVSYSFYCYAMAVLLVVAWVLLTVMPTPFAISDLGATVIVLATAGLCVAISLVLAAVSFAFIEKPCMAIGRAWSKRIEGGDTRAAAFGPPAMRYAPSKIASGSSAETT
jgi:peptidoglycan/LPS O-acetylase OafA/YrhL